MLTQFNVRIDSKLAVLVAKDADRLTRSAQAIVEKALREFYSRPAQERKALILALPPRRGGIIRRYPNPRD